MLLMKDYGYSSTLGGRKPSGKSGPQNTNWKTGDYSQDECCLGVNKLLRSRVAFSTVSRVIPHAIFAVQ